MRPARFLLVTAALPPIVLLALAVAGARHDVGVVLTGGGRNAVLGAAWVIAWLASLTATPIAALAAAVSALLLRVSERRRARLFAGR
jgi:hypothetical protein